MNKNLAKKIYFRLFKKNFSSADYWENRYKDGGSSGSGSYGKLAEYKAKFLNEFVIKNEVQQVLELGCGDGNQLKQATYPTYIGLDVSPTAVQKCMKTFRSDLTKSFFLFRADCFQDSLGIFDSDLVISLDVIFHLIEDSIFEHYIDTLFNLSKKFVVIYSSNTDELINSNEAIPHFKHRKFSDYIEKEYSDWNLLEKINNPYKIQHDKVPSCEEEQEFSVSDFYVYKKIGK